MGAGSLVDRLVVACASYVIPGPFLPWVVVVSGHVSRPPGPTGCRQCLPFLAVLVGSMLFEKAYEPGQGYLGTLLRWIMTELMSS
jgi:hypothetical protein